MDQLFTQIITHPAGAVALFFAFAEAVAFIIFLWGFSGWILAHEHESHQKHADTSMVWGATWIVVLFILWELARWVGGIFIGVPVVFPVAFIAILLLIAFGFLAMWYTALR